MSDDYGRSVVTELRTKLAASAIESSDTWDEVVQLESKLEEGIEVCTPSSLGSGCGGCRNCKNLRNELRTIRSTNSELQQLRNEYTSAVDERIELHSELATLHTSDLTSVNSALLSELSHTKEQLIEVSEEYNNFKNRYQIVVSELRDEIATLRNRTPSSVTPARGKSALTDLNENDESLHSLHTPKTKKYYSSTPNAILSDGSEQIPQSVGRNRAEVSELKKIINNLESEVKQLQVRRGSPDSSSEVEHLNEIVRQLQRQNESLKHRNSVVISELRDEVSTLRKNSTPRKYIPDNQLEVTPVSTSKINSATPETRHQLRQLRDENESLKQRHSIVVSDLREELTILRRNNGTPQRLTERTTISSVDAAERIELKRRLRQLQSENEDLKQQQESNITALEDEIQGLRDIIPIKDQNSTELLLLKSELATVQDEADDAKEELSDLRRRLSQTQNSTTIANVTEERNQIEEALHNLEAEFSFKTIASDKKISQLLQEVTEKSQLISEYENSSPADQKNKIIIKLESERDLLTDEVTELRKTNRKLHQSEDNQILIESLKAERDSLAAEVHKLTDNPKSSPSAKRVTELESRVAELFEQKDLEISRLLEENSAKGEQVRQLHTENGTLKRENTTRVTELETRVAELFEEKDSEIERLLRENEQIKQTNTNEQVTSPKLCLQEDRIIELEEELIRSEVRIEQQEQQISKQSTEIKTLSDKEIPQLHQVEELQKLVEQQHHHITNTDAQLEDNEKLISLGDKAVQENKNLMLSLEEAERQAADVEQQLSQLYQEKENVAATLRDENSHLRDAYNKLTTQCDSVVSELETELVSLRQNKSATPTDRTPVKENTPQYELIMSKVRQEISVLENKSPSACLRDEVARYEIIVEELENEIAALRVMDTPNKSTTMENENLRVANDSLKNKLSSLQHQYDTLLKENSDVSQQLQSTKQLYDELKTRISGDSLQNSLLEDAHNQIDELRIENAVLKEKITESDSQQEGKNGSSLNSLLEDAQGQIDELRMENALLKEKISRTENSNSDTAVISNFSECNSSKSKHKNLLFDSQHQTVTKRTTETTPDGYLTDGEDSLFDVISTTPKTTTNSPVSKRHNELVDEIYMLRRDNQSHVDKVFGLQSEVQILKRDNTELAKQLHNTLQQEDGGTDVTLLSLQSENESLKRKLSIQKENNICIQQLEYERDSLKTTLCQLEEKQQSNVEYEKRSAQLKVRYESLKKDNLLLVEEVNNFKSEISELQQQSNVARKTHGGELLAVSQSNSVLEKRVGILSQENANLSDMVTKLQSEANDDKMKNLTNTISKLQTQLNSTKRELESATQQIETLKGGLNRFTEEAAQTGIEFCNLQRINGNITTQLEVTSEENHTLKRTIKDLQSNLEDNSKLSDENKKLKLTQDEHISDCKKAMEDAILLSTEVGRLRDIEVRYEKIASSLTAEKESSNVLRQEFDSCESEIRTQLKSVETLKYENTKLVSENEKLQQKLSTATASEYGEEVEVMRETNAVLGKEVATLTKEVLVLRKSHQTMTARETIKSEVPCP